MLSAGPGIRRGRLQLGRARAGTNKDNRLPARPTNSHRCTAQFWIKYDTKPACLFNICNIQSCKKHLRISEAAAGFNPPLNNSF